MTYCGIKKSKDTIAFILNVEETFDAVALFAASARLTLLYFTIGVIPNQFNQSFHMTLSELDEIRFV